MNLENNILLLTPLSLKELNGNYIHWLNDPDVCRYNSHNGNYTLQKAIAYINNVSKKNNIQVFAVYLKENNKHIGNISLQQINTANLSAELAYLFGEKEEWGKGYATQATNMLIDYAFNTLKLHRLYLGTHQNNIAMQKVAQKCGFVQEGVQTDALYKNGKFYNTIHYALINR